MFTQLLLLIPRPPSSTLFPYTTLFRSDFAHLPFAGLEVDALDPRAEGLEAVLDAVVAAVEVVDALDHRLAAGGEGRSEEHTSELQSQSNLVCRPLLEKKKHPPQTEPQY